MSPSDVRTEAVSRKRNCFYLKIHQPHRVLGKIKTTFIYVNSVFSEKIIDSHFYTLL